MELRQVYEVRKDPSSVDGDEFLGIRPRAVWQLWFGGRLIRRRFVKRRDAVQHGIDLTGGRARPEFT